MAEEQKPTPGSIPIEINGKTYEIFPVAPPPNADVEELSKLLAHNRKLLNQCKDKYNKAYAPIAELLERGLTKKAGNKRGKTDFDSIVANACIARMNISKLVPLITMKGGDAFLTKPETFTISKHVGGMMKGLEGKAKKAKRKKLEEETANNNWVMWVTLVLIMLLVIALMKNLL